MRKKLTVCCTAFLLALLLTVPALAASSAFQDVPETADCYESVIYLADHEITQGTGNGCFSPNAPVTVRQWAMMLCRAYDMKVEGSSWGDLSQRAVEQSYRKGWLNETARSAPNIQLCRGALLKSAFAAAKIPVYDSVLYAGGVSNAANEIVTCRDAAMLLHAILTRAFTVETPPASVMLVNAAGWTYRIDFDYINELSKQLNMSCIGATNYSQKTLYISEANATLHEFGHFLDWQLGFPAEHEQLYLAEAQNSGLRDYAKTNAREYFADCFDYWIAYSGNEKRMEIFRNAAPQIWAYFEALEKNNWRS